VVTLRQNTEDQYPPGRNYLALFLLLLAVFSGISFIFRVILGQQGALALILPLPAEIAWNVLLFGGSAVAFVGGFWKDPLTGRLLERAGLIALGAAAIAYGVAVTGRAVIQGLGGGITNAITLLLFGIFVLLRTRQIKRELEFFASRVSQNITIYSLFGGREGLENIVIPLYEKILADPLIGHYFVGKDISRIRNHITSIFASITGGPPIQEFDIPGIHRGLGISDTDFDRFLMLLKNVMREREVDPTLIEWMIKRLELFRTDVVEEEFQGEVDL
jgi:hemoglobin